MKIIPSLILFVLLSDLVNAQSLHSTADIFMKTTKKINSLRSISYNIKSTEINPFSQGDVTLAVIKADIVFKSDGTISFKKEQTNLNSGQNVFKEIYSGGKSFWISEADSTYTEEVAKDRVSCEMTDNAIMMERELMKNASKILRRIDTVFAGKRCYSFLIRSYDSIINGNHDYTHIKLLIDKKTLLPVYLKTTGAGTATKKGFSLGRLNFYNEKIFYGFTVNKKINVVPFVNSGFTLPNTEMLKIGEEIPDLLLTNLSGFPLSKNDLKGKLLLVVFGGTACAANPLANPMLNRLHLKYSSARFSIINIYTNETTEQMKKYIEHNSLKFPVYLGSKKLNKAFKTLGTPNFYLISGEGKVVRSYDGYRESLEKDLIVNINQLLEKPQY